MIRDPYENRFYRSHLPGIKPEAMAGMFKLEASTVTHQLRLAYQQCCEWLQNLRGDPSAYGVLVKEHLDRLMMISNACWQLYHRLSNEKAMEKIRLLKIICEAAVEYNQLLMSLPATDTGQGLESQRTQRFGGPSSGR